MQLKYKMFGTAELLVKHQMHCLQSDEILKTLRNK